MLMVVFAALAVITTAPRLRSAMDAASTFTQTNLISDVPGIAKTTDPNLVNPWGMALGINSGIWVSDNGSGKATTYDGKGQPILPQVITIPSPAHSAGGAPTGAATNDTTGFVISARGKSGPATELFATEDGTIAGWNTGVDPAKAVIAVNNSASAQSQEIGSHPRITK
jgi:uncharacterized protein (TIGR03118 family)